MFECVGFPREVGGGERMTKLSLLSFFFSWLIRRRDTRKGEEEEEEEEEGKEKGKKEKKKNKTIPLAALSSLCSAVHRVVRVMASAQCSAQRR